MCSIVQIRDVLTIKEFVLIDPDMVRYVSRKNKEEIIIDTEDLV